jgi:carbon-monoxide dehydrogenase large subunit
VGFGIGQAVERKEDARFLTGAGNFQDEINLPGQAHAVILRSPHAHADIATVDSDDARAAPGVLAVLTSADVRADGIGTLPSMKDPRLEMTRRDGSPGYYPPQPLLADGRVRHVGEAVAMVVAETMAQALSAVERIAVKYRALPAIVDTAQAAGADALQLWSKAPGNVCFDWIVGDKSAVEAAFARAEHVIEIELRNNRVTAAPIETRGALGEFNPVNGRYTLHTNCHNHFAVRGMTAECLGLEPANLRVIARDIGGGFGMKYFVYPEHPLVLWAARRLARPVKWMSGRNEAFLSDTQGRDHVTKAALALDTEAHFLALKVDTVANLGAYVSHLGPISPSLLYTEMLSGAYATPAIYAEVKGVFSNTIFTDAYRGAGRPEATYVVERLADEAARRLGLAPDEIRRRNFVTPDQMPYRAPLGLVYDSGDFPSNLESCQALIDWPGFSERRAASQRAGRLRGIGISSFVEKTGTFPEEIADIRFHKNGEVTVHVGTMASGQGHETAFAQLVHDKLGVDFERVRVVEGDSDDLPRGYGSGGSRSANVGGTAIYQACLEVEERARAIAAHMLEVAPEDIAVGGGRYTVRGTDRVMTLAEIAEVARDANNLPDGIEVGLDVRAVGKVPDPTFPNGCQICELEVDPDTGALEIVRYGDVGDFGRVLNPMIVEGQIHGGIAQGVGQALMEDCRYDPDSGQLLSASFMDYTLPRADDFPNFDTATREILCTTNPLGIKGAGEAGTIGALAAVMNALMDALAPLGVRHIDMPATPETVWRAIRDAQRT